MLIISIIIHVLFLFHFILSKKLRYKLSGQDDDADTDSYSDGDFNGHEDTEKSSLLIDEEQKLRLQHKNFELLEKRYRTSYTQLINYVMITLSTLF